MNFYKKTPFAMKRMFANLISTRNAMSAKERKEFDKWFALEQFKTAARTMSTDELVELKAEIVRLTKEKEERTVPERTSKVRTATVFRPGDSVYSGFLKE